MPSWPRWSVQQDQCPLVIAADDGRVRLNYDLNGRVWGLSWRTSLNADDVVTVQQSTYGGSQPIADARGRSPPVVEAWVTRATECVRCTRGGCV